MEMCFSPSNFVFSPLPDTSGRGWGWGGMYPPPFNVVLHIHICRRLPMARTTYTADQKMAALVELERCRGDILRASLNTGIPERTLYTWRRRFYAENKQQ